MNRFVFAGIFFATLGAVQAAPLQLQPGTLLEELRTGVVTISNEKIRTEKGQETALKLVKIIKGVKEDADRVTRYFEVVGDDEIGHCDDATAADYISVLDYGEYAGVVVEALQNRTNDKGQNYVIRCGEFSYDHPK